jgi:hypothetical protein
MAQQDPTGPNEAILQGNPVSQIPADRAEGVLSLLKLTPHEQPSSMGDLIGQHHQIRLANAQMYSNAAKTALHSQLMIQHGIDPESGQRFDDPGYKGPSAQDQAAKYQANYNEAWTNYKKLAGVDQNTKGALAKAEQILNHILGGGAMQSAPGAPSDQGRAGGMTPPPQAGLSGTAGGPSQVEAAAPAPAGQAQLTPPPRPNDVSANPLAAPMIEANTQFEQGQQRLTAEQQRKFKTDVEQRTKEADILGLQEGSRIRAQYIATGNFPAVGRLQKMLYKDPKTGDVKQGSYNPIEGTIEDQEGQVVQNAQPASPADLATHTVNLMTPDGPRMMFREGNKVYDNQHNLQDGELVPFTRGMVPTTTDREVMGFDDQGNPTKYLLRSTRTVNVGPIPSPMASPTAGAAQQTGGGTAAPLTSKGRMSTPPKPQGGGGAVAQAGGGGGKSGKTVYPAGQFMQFSKSATGVDQARNSLVGDDIEKGKVSGLAKDLDIFKDQSAVARIGEYLQLVHNLTAREGDSFAQSDDTVGAVKWFAGMPQAVIGLQQGALRDKYNQLTTADKKFVADYFRAMGTMGGMRASTGMPGYQWSFTNMYNEMPTPGKVTDYDDAVRRLMNYVNETNVVSKRNPMVPKVDVEDAERQIRGGNSSKGGMTAPPKSSSKAIFF